MFKKASKDAWNVVKRGNMFMLAIGLLLGAAFNELVKSLANDIIMPPIAKMIGTQSFEKWEWQGMLIGKFLGALIAFLITATIIYIFLMIVFLIRGSIIAWKNKRKPAEPEKLPEPTTEELILEELKKLNEKLSK
ncbi:large conductance mechanosensitive channel protein [Mycoplasmopsis bovigenitalium]|uniref:Large conductance mechanosensitive channel protein n=1 Tax=Mycoplasmopsis bovigenitalium TaxID=2112 RepID=A0A449A9N9_9BACT|nr:MscL family protein [Mycoplasmopsis bovigenitalium]VEU60993.1 large conductance mechanosensitive channel protein [Mycoplasmopsis bovigenitalium]